MYLCVYEMYDTWLRHVLNVCLFFVGMYVCHFIGMEMESLLGERKKAMIAQQH